MFCKNCGHELPDDAKFCPHCGTGFGGPQPSGEPQRPADDHRQNVSGGTKPAAASGAPQWEYSSGAQFWLAFCCIGSFVPLGAAALLMVSPNSSSLTLSLGDSFFLLYSLAANFFSGLFYFFLWKKKAAFGLYGVGVIAVLTFFFSLLAGYGFIMSAYYTIAPAITYFVVRKYLFTDA